MSVLAPQQRDAPEGEIVEGGNVGNWINTTWTKNTAPTRRATCYSLVGTLALSILVALHRMTGNSTF